MKYRISKRDWDNIQTAVNMIAAGEWDSSSYGPRPDWEKLLKKIEERVSNEHPSSNSGSS